ncbi:MULTISPECIES: hypothetical protein [Rhizobium]|uniref:hypothetical protein n=1 Tax=Rhizobium TaxID=379 RepID=UPI000FEC59CA|nr:MULTISPECIES: hypothetical protein [Rhizobium]NEI03758.1 hypothetical protein [Rhizobium ruizarguesonis]RWX08395.1 hypothetical protein EHI45_24325 [Rhizobium leguminosarum]TBA34683.1 hypothetical protein ELH63_29240 [Rhizobium ruizarguesonis]
MTMILSSLMIAPKPGLKSQREMESVWSTLWQNFVRMGPENCPSFIIVKCRGMVCLPASEN